MINKIDLLLHQTVACASVRITSDFLILSKRELIEKFADE
jgi:hypothetical protein